MEPFLAAAVVSLSCGIADDVFSRLQARYGEVKTYSATLNDDNQTTPIVLTTSSTGSWTMLQIRGELACVLAVGEHWGGALRSPLEKPLPDPPSVQPSPTPSRPSWPPQWPDGLCPCGDYLRGISYDP